MNMRGCGDGEVICPLLYSAGLDTDLLAAVEAVAGAVPRVGVVGFSLGANLALLALGRQRECLPSALGAVVAVCPPLDLSTCADALERPGNRLYQRHFVAMLADGYRRRRKRRPDLFGARRERGVRTVREFDDRITAPYGGYGGAAEYYARCSSGPHLLSIDRPALVLASADDPMIPVESVTRWRASPAVVREIEPTGGHVGFVGRSAAPGFFWAPERALLFLEEHLWARA
jgi:predicted alpha/beta-fold hydrolase